MTQTPTPRYRRFNLSLRARLMLLVFGSILPLLTMGVVREALDYTAERDRTYEGLMTIANGTAIAIERDLQLRIAALETLAMSPALQDGDLDAFGREANLFLLRQAKGATLGVADPNLHILRLYGLKDPSTTLPPSRARGEVVRHRIFDLGRPAVMNLLHGRISDTLGFSIDVPVFHDGKVVYDLYLRLQPGVLKDLVADQRLGPASTVTVADGDGLVVARTPSPDRYIGVPIVPELRKAILAQGHGMTPAPTLEGVPSVAAFTRIGDTDWTVIAGAHVEAISAPLRAALERVLGVGVAVMALGLALAALAARGITQPIEALGRLAASDQATPAAASGLPETDLVAAVLARAAAERQDAARALAESEQRFRALFERAPSGTILLDPDTMCIVDCNEAAASFVGLDTASFRGRRITDFALQTPPERARQICREVVAGQTYRYETRIQGGRGIRHLLIATAPVRVAGRTMVLLSQIDVTDLRAAQADLRVNEERLELAREGADLGIWDWDIRSDTWTWSENQWRLHGLVPDAEGLRPAEWERVMVPSDLPRVRADLLQAVGDPASVYSTEYGVVLPDGSLRRLLGRGKTIRGAEGEAIRMVGICMDVTARYEAETARDRLISVLETERSRLTSIIASLPVGVGIIDDTGRVVLGNETLRRFTDNLLPSRAAGQAGTWVGYDEEGTRIQPADYPGTQALRGETVLPGIEFIRHAPDGSERWLRIGAKPLRRVDGKVLEALIFILDIDAEKRLLAIQQEINARLELRVRDEMSAREAAQQRAAHAERMHALGQIAGGIAHDFNNVLQAVSGGAALIERRPHDPERVLRNVRMVMDAAKRGAAITSRLLAFARRGDLRAEPIDVGVLLTDMAEVLSHTLGGSVVCQVDAPAGLPPMFADRGQLETVLVNLATNARDAMPSGGTLALTAGAETVAPGTHHPAGLSPGSYVRLAVTDTGTGMDRTVLARVTEPFFTTKEPGKGTGLGLAMAKGFTEQSGGSLAIESEPGVGTSIFIWLPQSGGPEAAPGLGTPNAANEDQDRPRVLLVDDDAIVRQVVALSLEESGHAVIAVDSGSAALARLASDERVDILVSDLTMPAMDGLTLIRKAQECRPGLPAVLLTGYAGDGAALAVGGAISGTFSLLRKPVSGQQLAERINALLEARREAAQAPGVTARHETGLTDP
ncbi:MAG TPA: PAS domain S-box protein [Rhodopila sp.]|uniref:PAS domain S-box protein n=1 Tax=Rhodopila sp. TaxID=2480087 RepID=UPI002BFC6CC4|nr:PAS domain S-box protein [Rhodopila sp.]HVY16243.1 PAS domain S-box protein [Rhodopila sp.]